MTASSEHDLIVSLVARTIRQQGFELVALESSFDWLFGKNFQLPPAIIVHRPDILGVRREPPYLCIGEAKTRGDLHSKRTRRQLVDFSQATIGNTGALCHVVVGIPQDAEDILEGIIGVLGIPPDRILVLPIPRPLLGNRKT